MAFRYSRLDPHPFIDVTLMVIQGPSIMDSGMLAYGPNV